MAGEQRRAGVDEVGLDERLVALHVHDDVRVGKPEQPACLGEAVASCRVVAPGEQGGHAVRLASEDDLGVVRGDHYLSCA